MRYIRIAFFLAFGAAAAAARPQAPDVTGDWDLTINSPQGTREVKASFQQTGENLKGLFRSPRGELAFEGTVKGKEIKFSYTIQFQGGELPITMTGDVDGDAIKGTADFGGLAQGDWTAKRALPGAAVAAAPTPAAPAAGALDVTGTWQFKVETSGGSGEPTFTFKQQGEHVTGQYKGLLGEAPVTGTVKGNAIAFSFKVNIQGTDATVSYSGTVDGDSMKGTASLGEIGSGTFTATRKKD